jgi:hypothetical protein
MKLSAETANLEIDHIQTIVANQNTAIRIVKDVNMRQLLGEMYYKYKKFYIEFTSIGGFGGATTYNAGTFTAIGNAPAWLLQMSGLDFVNNTVNGTITKTAIFPLGFSLPVNGFSTGVTVFANTPTQFGVGNGIVFNKEMNDNTTLTIIPVLNANLLPCFSQPTVNISLNLTLNFSIYGLEE